MYGLSAGSFQQVVYAGDDKELVAVLFQMDKAFVGVDNLLQIDVLVDDMREGVFGIILFIHADNLFQRHFGLYHDSGKDAAGKITAIRDEINVRIETVLELFERLLDFGHVLVLESLVHTQVVVAPAEVARSSRLDARTCAAGDGIHHNIAVQHQMLGKRKQAQLDAGGEAAGVGNMLCRAGGTAVQLGKAVDEVMVVALDAIVHGEVDYLQVFRYVVAFHEFSGVAMRRAEEKHIDFVQRKFVGKR